LSCPKCGYAIVPGAACCPECGLPTRGRPLRFDGEQDLRHLLGRLWRITGLVCLPNLVLAALFWFHGPGIPGWLQPGTLQLIGIGEMILLWMHWTRVRSLQERASEGCEKFGSRRVQQIWIEGWIGRLCFVGSVGLWMAVLGMRSG
jgi:hypothetical protein